MENEKIEKLESEIKALESKWDGLDKQQDKAITAEHLYKGDPNKAKSIGVGMKILRGEISEKKEELEKLKSEK